MNTFDIFSQKATNSENFSLSLKKMNSLLEMLEKYFTKKNYEINFQLIYSKCHELCQQRLANDLFSKLDDLIFKIVKENCEVLSKTQTSEEFSFKLNKIFSTFKLKSLTISDALLYLDRINQRFRISELTIYETCIFKFFNQILMTDAMKNKILEVFFDFIFKLRSEKFSNSTKNSEIKSENEFEKISENFEQSQKLENDLIFFNLESSNNFKILKILIEFKLFRTSQNFEKFKIANNFYHTEFFEKLKMETEKFYSDYFEKNFSDSKFSHENCLLYIKRISEIITVEESLWKSLDNETNQILEIILDNLLIKKIDFIFHKGVRKFLKQKNFQIMKIIYKLFIHIDTKEKYKNQFYEIFQTTILNHLKETETNLIKINNLNKIEYINFYQYVDELFENKKIFFYFLENSFENNSKIEQIIKYSFEKVINKHDDFLEHFVQLLHEEIKISIKTRNNKIKEFNEKFLTIFKLINDKDYFELQYRKYLAKRLLRNTTMMKETEYDFYFLMEKHSGTNFVKKIENMLNDIYSSKDLNNKFRKFRNKRKENCIDPKIETEKEKEKEAQKSLSNKILNKNKMSCRNYNSSISNTVDEDNLNSIITRKSDSNFNLINLNLNLKMKKNNLNEVNKNNHFSSNNETNTNFQMNLKSNRDIIDLSQASHNNFSSQQSSLDFYVKVISHENWPIEGITIKTNRRDSFSLLDVNKAINNYSFSLPYLIDDYINSFTIFYFDKFKNRQLTWADSLSWAEVHGKFPNKSSNSKTYSFILSAIQVAVLYLFNSKSNYTYEEITKSLKISENNNNLKFLSDNLTPLIVCGLLKISNINKNFKNSLNFNNKDIIGVNHNFKSESNKKLNLNISNNKEKIQNMLEEDKEISHFVVEDRKHQIDSVIIKIMKKFKSITFEEMKLQIVKSVSNFFVPDINLIKIRLENLMERNFIKRDEDDPNKYLYML